MSEAWSRELDAMRVAPRTMRAPTGFTPWSSRLDVLPEPMALDEDDAPDLGPAPVIDPEAIALDGFAKGFEEARRVLEAQLAEERAALQRLAQSLADARPEPAPGTAALIAHTVRHLLHQAVGEVAVDDQLLQARAAAAAALVADDARPARLRLHPDDLARIGEAAAGLDRVADAGLTPGNVVVECRDGWIEHGPRVALARLDAQLAALGAPR